MARSVADLVLVRSDFEVVPALVGEGRRILRDFTLDLQGGFSLRTRQMPTIGPRDGLPVIVRDRRRG